MPETPLKILLITDTETRTGGAEKHFFTLKQALQKRSHLSVYSLVFGADKSENTSSHVLQETASKISRQWWRMFLNPVKYREIRRVIHKIKPDVIHLHNIKKYTISLLKAVKPYPVVQTVHDYSSICPTGWNVHENMQPCPTGMKAACCWRHKRGYNSFVYLGMLFSFYRMRTLLKKTVREFIAPSPLLEHYLRINQFTPTAYLPPFSKHHARVDFSNMRAGNFLFVGQLEIQKGIDKLINEFALACRQNKNLMLKIAGNGSLENFLKQQVKELHCEENIIFLGWVEPEKYYDECMALIFPSIGLESFGMVITEAMAKARAVIGSNRGPTSWLVEDGKSGLLFDPLIPGDLAEKILLLGENLELAKKFGESGYEKLNIFLDEESIINSVLKLYDSGMTAAVSN